MSNMKIISMLGHDSKQIRADNEADIATVLAVVEALIQRFCRLILNASRPCLSASEARDGTVLSVTRRKRRSRGGQDQMRTDCGHVNRTDG